MRITSWGAPGADVGGMRDVGRVHVYMGTASGLSSTPALSLTGLDGANGYFGSSVASAGDLHGEGFADSFSTIRAWNAWVNASVMSAV